MIIAKVIKIVLNFNFFIYKNSLSLYQRIQFDYNCPFLIHLRKKLYKMIKLARVVKFYSNNFLLLFRNKKQFIMLILFKIYLWQ